MFRLLSYPLNLNTPLYGDTEPVRIEERQNDLGEGSCIRTSSITISNHAGTHIDAPRHFFTKGKSVSEYDINAFIFNSPQLIECPKGDNELVLPEDLETTRKNCDLLLIRTGFHRFRGQGRYRTDNPGISPLAAEWLRMNRAQVRAVGIDSLSISAFRSRPVGRKAHQIFLCRDGFPGDPVLLIEDLDLSGDLGNLSRIFAIPLFLEGVDSMPCSVVGEYQ